ncbi:MAG: cupredoxin domain-containing protein [Acidobacteriaceae bacterium]|jgi:cytochrome c oxidase subunit 2
MAAEQSRSGERGGLIAATRIAGAAWGISKGGFMKRRSMLLGLLVGIALAGMTPVHSVKAQAAPRRIEVTAKRFAFDPGEITVKKGQPVVLVLHGKDAAHGLRFRDLNVDVKVRAGGTSEVQFTPDKAGDFVGHCSVFCGSGHGGMMLTLHVVD